MKKTYSEPELELVFVSTTDVLTASTPKLTIDTDLNTIGFDTDSD